MRKTLASIVAAASLMVAPVAAVAGPPEHEFGTSALAALSNLWYTPAKVVVAAIGLPVGAAAGFLSGGDTRTAYAVWVPMVGGTYFLTADHMDGRAPLEFFGRDYADRPGMYGRTHHGGSVYDAGYIQR